MGYAIAEAALEAGHEVVLISGPTSLTAPKSAVFVNVETAAEMLEEVKGHLDQSDALIMAAAVADWRPKRIASQKIKKGHATDCIELERTADILEDIRASKGRQILVGFAAETENLIVEAHRKLRDKGVDLIVANDVSCVDSGFDVDTNKAMLLSADGKSDDLPLMTKHDLAQRIVDWVWVKHSTH